VKNGKSALLTTLVLALSLSGWPSAHAQSEITLLAPFPATKQINQIVANFEAKTQYKVKVTYAPGLDGTRTVAKGNPLDVNLIIAPVTGAVTSGTVIPSSETVVASYVTAVAVPKGAPKPDISTPAAVKKALLAAKSIGYEDPDFTSAGQAPALMIYTLGIGDQIAAKSKLCAGAAYPYSPNSTCFDPSGTGPGGSVRHIVKQVAEGQVDFAMLFLSDMLPSKDKFDIVGVLPRKICPVTSIVGLISTRASNPAGAKALLQYFLSPDAQAIFKDAGFEPHS